LLLGKLKEDAEKLALLLEKLKEDAPKPALLQDKLKLGAPKLEFPAVPGEFPGVPAPAVAGAAL
jgi:hypothetical protein